MPENRHFAGGSPPEMSAAFVKPDLSYVDIYALKLKEETICLFVVFVVKSLMK
ncbi:hypothetical protein JCM39194_09190 [Desulfotomaculum varum]